MMKKNNFGQWSDWNKAKEWLTARIIPLTKTSAQYLSDRPYQMITNIDAAVVWDLITMQLRYQTYSSYVGFNQALGSYNG